MTKELKDMTLQELWDLFPIILEEPGAPYQDWYKTEADKIKSTISKSDIFRLSHIGSTAVPGLLAKPTVDILLELQSDYNLDKVMDHLNQLGWGLMSKSNGPRLNYSFQKGYTKYGFDEKVYHLHLRLKGDCKVLYFRDYLIANPQVAQAYAQLKKDLQVTYRNNRDAYTDAKTDFINKYTDMAMSDYNGRY